MSTNQSTAEPASGSIDLGLGAPRAGAPGPVPGTIWVESRIMPGKLVLIAGSDKHEEESAIAAGNLIRSAHEAPPRDAPASKAIKSLEEIGSLPLFRSKEDRIQWLLRNIFDLNLLAEEGADLDGAVITRRSMQRFIDRPEFVHGSTTSVTGGYEPLIEGIGTTPLGGRGVDYLPVPEAPTTAPNRRYLGHLASCVVPQGYRGRLIDLRMASFIGLRVQVPEGEMIVYDLEQTSPFWRFIDGNWTIFLQVLNNPVQNLRGTPLGFPRNFSGDDVTSDTCWLATQVAPSYIPTNGGMPPGMPFTFLPEIHSLYTLWRGSLQERLDGELLLGPDRLGMYISLYQTNPTRNRGPQPENAPVPGGPEDTFVKNNPGLVRYTGVAGSLTMRLEKIR